MKKGTSYFLFPQFSTAHYDTFQTNNMNTDLQLVPESLLKKRHDLDALKARRAAALLSNPRTSRKNVSKKQLRILKPETILCQARARKNAGIRYNRVQKKGMQKRASNDKVVKKKYWDEDREEEIEESEVLRQKELEAAAAAEAENEVSDAEEDVTSKKKKKNRPTEAHVQEIPYCANSIGASTIFCTLIRPAVHTTPKTVRRTLSTLRLRKVHEGVFLQYTPAVRKMLHLVEPYVLYGVPSVETIGDLVRRRGFCKIDGKRVQISDNNIIEEQLGDAGLICVEDLIAVLTSKEIGDEAFGRVSKFLWPFRMSARKSKFQKRLLDLKDGKLYGDQGEVMNGYIREML